MSCPFCKVAGTPETVAHMVWECAAWGELRTGWLTNEVDAINSWMLTGNVAQKAANVLLGGSAEGHKLPDWELGSTGEDGKGLKIEETCCHNVAKFLQELRPLRAQELDALVLGGNVASSGGSSTSTSPSMALPLADARQGMAARDCARGNRDPYA